MGNTKLCRIAARAQLKLVVVAILAVLYCCAAREAQAFDYAEDADEVFNAVREKLLPHVSSPHRKALKQIKFRVDDQSANPLGVYAIKTSTGRRFVACSEQFFIEFDQFVSAWLIEAQTNRSNLAFNWLYSVEFRKAMGAPQISLVEFARMSAEERARLKENKGFNAGVRGMYVDALVFAFAHEMGHHALDKFMTESTTDEESRLLEEEVDRWATTSLLASGMAPVGCVALMCYAQLRGLCDGNVLEPRTHPDHTARGLAAVRYARSNPRLIRPGPFTTLRDVENKLEEIEMGLLKVRRMLKGVIAHFEEEAEAGSLKAKHICAMYYLWGGRDGGPNHSKALEFMQEATAGPQVDPRTGKPRIDPATGKPVMQYHPPAMYLAGRMYERGVGVPEGMPVDQRMVMARVMYRGASKWGHLRAKQALSRLSR